MNHFSEAEIRAFKDKDYRQAYFDEFLNSYIATQIKVLREQRTWTQEQLGKLANMKQSQVSRLENVNYSGWSIKTLQTLAEAFDLTLCVSFESFSKRLGDFDRFSRENLEKVSFDDDSAFKEENLEGISKSFLLATQKDFERTNVIQLENYRGKIGSSDIDKATQSQSYAQNKPIPQGELKHLTGRTGESL